MASATAAEVRQARAYLVQMGIKPSQVSPRKFASAANELGKSFRETLNILIAALSGGQGMGPAKMVTRSRDRTNPIEAAGDQLKYLSGQAHVSDKFNK